jgi:squalene-associated FAD-dependent desaturase
MTMSLLDSYSRCENIARHSGSSFYRSFSLLGLDRRHAMTALYAFARLADDATDDESQAGTPSTAWAASEWHDWIDALYYRESFHSQSTRTLEPIRLAMADAVAKFSIPLEPLHDIVRGVGTDVCETPIVSRGNGPAALVVHPPVRMKSWEETSIYCHRVASSVGIACLSIWSRNIGEPPSLASVRAALDCGVAFQMTNILRDLGEDSERNRIYLPQDELARFGIDSAKWLALHASPTVFAINEMGDWRGLIRLQIERTKAMYASGWEVANSISLDGQRMFSLMWHSYHHLLQAIEKSPERIWQNRVQLSKLQKVRLIGQHLFTPSFKRVLASKKPARVSSDCGVRHVWPAGGLRVAVVGAGLAGINAALHLARHGCHVTLLESKNRLGGRVGSFVDSESGQSIDYCQHVGMNCCKTLKEWIQDTSQGPFWTEQDSLHFVSPGGSRIRVIAWPLPAPLHLSGLLFRWPQLGISDRVRIGIALLRLKRLKRDSTMGSKLAIDWLRSNGQNDRCIKNFWGTILVSALGEQVDRVTLEATHKVLIDGFATDRNGFHLLVPNRPLSELLDDNVSRTLIDLGVEVRLGEIVKGIYKNQTGGFQLNIAAEDTGDVKNFDAVVVALPWNKVSAILPVELQSKVQSAGQLQSSPITGIHTWWDRPWLREPHAILINRFCQWIFPAPQSHGRATNVGTPHQTKEHYYQIVISASSNLPSGDTELILKSIKQDLAEIFPESAVSTLLRGRVVTDPNAVFSVSVGHEASRLASGVLSDERIWLAGDWTLTQWPATMEGALRSGAEAAQGVLCAFGRNAAIVENSP